MAYNSDSTVHRVGYMFLAFSHLTDGEVDNKELGTLAGILWAYLEAWDQDLTGDGVVDFDDAVKLIDNDLIPYYNAQDDDSRIQHFSQTVNMLKAQDWWTDDFANMLLRQLKMVADADGHYHDNEKEWIRITADRFGVSAPA